MNATTTHTYATTKATMDRAFALVCPSEHAKELAARGMISEADAAKVTWRDRIAAVVTDDMLVAHGLTISDVAAAIEFFTATKAEISRERIAGLSWVYFLQETPGYLVTADGYRRGPAGDH